MTGHRVRRGAACVWFGSSFLLGAVLEALLGQQPAMGAGPVPARRMDEAMAKQEGQQLLTPHVLHGRRACTDQHFGKRAFRHRGVETEQ